MEAQKEALTKIKEYQDGIEREINTMKDRLHGHLVSARMVFDDLEQIGREDVLDEPRFQEFRTTFGYELTNSKGVQLNTKPVKSKSPPKVHYLLKKVVKNFDKPVTPEEILNEAVKQRPELTLSKVKEILSTYSDNTKEPRFQYFKKNEDGTFSNN